MKNPVNFTKNLLTTEVGTSILLKRARKGASIILLRKRWNRMPTFNQLVRKRLLLRSLLHLLSRRVTTLFTRKQQTFLLPRSVVYVPLLRQQLLKSLTLLLERSPEYVFPTESKLPATFPVKVTICRSTALFWSVVVVLRTCPVPDTTSSVVPLILPVSLTENRLVPSTVLRDLRMLRNK